MHKLTCCCLLNDRATEYRASIFMGEQMLALISHTYLTVITGLSVKLSPFHGKINELRNQLSKFN